MSGNDYDPALQARAPLLVNDSGPHNYGIQDDAGRLPDLGSRPKDHGVRAFIYTLFRPFIPEFLPNHMDFERHIPFLGGAGLAFYTELLLVLVLLIMPFYKTVNDARWGISKSGARVIWDGHVNLIGVSTLLLFLTTWIFGYISASSWNRFSPIRVSMYGAHLSVATARTLTCGVLMLMIWFNAFFWLFGEFTYLNRWLFGMWCASVIHLAGASLRYHTSRVDDRLIFQRSQSSLSDPAFDSALGLKLRLPSLVERKKQQTDAQSRLTCKSNTTLRDAVWHFPRPMVDPEHPSFQEKTRPSGCRGFYRF